MTPNVRTASVASDLPPIETSLKQEKGWFGRKITTGIEFKTGEEVIFHVACKQKWQGPFAALFNPSLKDRKYVQITVENADVYVKVSDALAKLEGNPNQADIKHSLSLTDEHISKISQKSLKSWLDSFGNFINPPKKSSYESYRNSRIIRPVVEFVSGLFFSSTKKKEARDDPTTWINRSDNKKILDRFLESSTLKSTQKVLKSIEKSLKDIGRPTLISFGSRAPLEESLKFMRNKLVSICNLAQEIKNKPDSFREAKENYKKADKGLFLDNGEYLSRDNQTGCLIKSKVLGWINAKDENEVDLSEACLTRFFSGNSEKAKEFQEKLSVDGVAELCPRVLVFQAEVGALKEVIELPDWLPAKEALKHIPMRSKKETIVSIIRNSQNFEDFKVKTLKIKSVRFAEPLVSVEKNEELEEQKRVVEEALVRTVSNTQTEEIYARRFLTELFSLRGLSPLSPWITLKASFNPEKGAQVIQTGVSLAKGAFRALTYPPYVESLVKDFEKDLESVPLNGSLRVLSGSIDQVVNKLAGGKNDSLEKVLENPRNAKLLQGLTEESIATLKTVIGFCVLARLFFWVNGFEGKEDAKQIGVVRAVLRNEVTACMTQTNEKEKDLNSSKIQLEKEIKEKRGELTGFESKLKIEMGVLTRNKKRINNCKGNITRLTGTIKSLEKKVIEIEARLKDLRDEMNVLPTYLPK